MKFIHYLTMSSNMVFGMIYTISLVRTLTEVDYAKFLLIMAVPALVASVSNFGIPKLVMKLSANVNQLQDFTDFIFLRTVTAVCVAVAFCFLIPLVSNNFNTIELVLICLMAVCLSINIFLTDTCQMLIGHYRQLQLVKMLIYTLKLLALYFGTTNFQSGQILVLTLLVANTAIEIFITLGYLFFIKQPFRYQSAFRVFLEHWDDLAKLSLGSLSDMVLSRGFLLFIASFFSFSAVDYGGIAFIISMSFLALTGVSPTARMESYFIRQAVQNGGNKKSMGNFIYFMQLLVAFVFYLTHDYVFAIIFDDKFNELYFNLWMVITIGLIGQFGYLLTPRIYERQQISILTNSSVYTAVVVVGTLCILQVLGQGSILIFVLPFAILLRSVFTFVFVCRYADHN